MNALRLAETKTVSKNALRTPTSLFCQTQELFKAASRRNPSVSCQKVTQVKFSGELQNALSEGRDPECPYETYGSYDYGEEPQNGYISFREEKSMPKSKELGTGCRAMIFRPGDVSTKNIFRESIEKFASGFDVESVLKILEAIGPGLIIELTIGDDGKPNVKFLERKNGALEEINLEITLTDAEIYAQQTRVREEVGMQVGGTIQKSKSTEALMAAKKEHTCLIVANAMGRIMEDILIGLAESSQQYSKAA